MTNFSMLKVCGILTLVLLVVCALVPSQALAQGHGQQGSPRLLSYWWRHNRGRRRDNRRCAGGGWAWCWSDGRGPGDVLAKGHRSYWSLRYLLCGCVRMLEDPCGIAGQSVEVLHVGREVVLLKWLCGTFAVYARDGARRIAEIDPVPSRHRVLVGPS
jgi:hypothetical protein